MPIERVTCPECRTTLKSTKPAGFAAGEALACPKCGTYFAAEAVTAAKPVAAKPVAPSKARAVEVDDEDEDRPRKKKAKVRAVEDDDEDLDEPPRKKGKKSKKRDDDEGSYKTSPIRFVILGILIVIMLVLAVFLYLKWQREKEDNAAVPQVTRVAV